MRSDPTGPLRTDRGKAGPWLSLVKEAARSPEAAEGLAHAYRSLEPADRLRLVHAVTADGAGDDASTARALLTLLGVEEDPANARTIVEHLRKVGPEAVACERAPEARLGGNEREGTGMLIQPLHGVFVEVLVLSWRESGAVLRTDYDPMLSAATLALVPARFGLQPIPEPRPGTVAIDTIAQVLWRYHRRGGTLAGPLARFATLFGL